MNILIRFLLIHGPQSQTHPPFHLDRGFLQGWGLGHCGRGWPGIWLVNMLMAFQLCSLEPQGPPRGRGGVK